LQSSDLPGLAAAATGMRARIHPHPVVSYQIDRNINYTNYCTEYCSFCNFYRPLGSAEGYILPLDVIVQKIEETIALNGNGILLQGGLHPDLKIEWYEDLLRALNGRFGNRIWLHCFSAPEITNIAEVSGLTLRDTIARLRDAGLQSIPGGGAEILDDAVRYRISRLKCSTQDWIDVHRTAHSLGMQTTATMMFGCGETLEHRLNHLEVVRQIQEETGGFTAFIAWPFKREDTSLGRFVKQEATAADYLKTLAVARLYLENIPNVQSSWLTVGHKLCQLGLSFGANDVGSIMIEENVVSQAGAHFHSTEEQLRQLIRDAGYRPYQRDTLYRAYFLN
jgi:cyclic dehypoxanthinyl futalosine synthase